MTSKLKVNLINDSGDNNIITSDGSGDVTCKVSDLGVNQTTLTAKLEVNQDVHDGITAQFTNSNSGNSGSEVYLIKDSSSPADSDNIGTFKFLANDDGGSQKNFAQIQAVTEDATASSSDGSLRFSSRSNNSIAERMRIGTSGMIMIGNTDGDAINSNGVNITQTPQLNIARSGGDCANLCRNSNDGVIVNFVQAGSTEGTISVSGSTVSYNGFTGTHWSRLSDNSKPTILKGTILESLDEMMDWYQVQFDVAYTDAEGNQITITRKESYALGDGESVGDVITYTYKGNDYQATIIKEADVKHSKCKISDTVDAKNVYGVFQAWDNDDDNVNDMYIAQTGTFIVRLHSSVTTLNKGDLIQSNGDGTGKVQSDDIIRASTVAKVLSTTKIETYADGSYTVPCSLHC